MLLDDSLLGDLLGDLLFRRWGRAAQYANVNS